MDTEVQKYFFKVLPTIKDTRTHMELHLTIKSMFLPYSSLLEIFCLFFIVQVNRNKIWVSHLKFSLL